MSVKEKFSAKSNQLQTTLNLKPVVQMDGFKIPKVYFENLQTEVTSLLLKPPLTESDHSLETNGLIQKCTQDYRGI